MAFSSYGRQRSFGSRPSSNRGGGGRPGFNRGRSMQRGPMRKFIHPSKYVNTDVQEVQQQVYEPKHAFTDFGLHPQLVENITRHGYTTPTPIQDQAIPHLMVGKDLVGLANTGTGKTAAFLLPLIHKIMQDREQGALIVVPTRELAVQIEQEFLAFAKNSQLGVCLCIGGANIERQISTLRRNPHFVIGTPGRLKDLINRRTLDTKMFTNIVLDEVDRMLDIGFLQDIRFLLSHLPDDRHSLFFSATVNREAEEIMKALLRNPVHISVKTSENSRNIHQDVVKVGVGRNKIDVLHELLQQPEFSRVIVFGRTKHGINKLEELLTKRGIRAVAIHGNKTQGARQRSLEDIKRGRVQVLLATDVAARGIDIDDVSHVINFDEPQSYEDYVHRIGRTGRAGKIGKALTFIS